MVARGRVGEHNGQLAIYNPWYELLAPRLMTDGTRPAVPTGGGRRQAGHPRPMPSREDLRQQMLNNIGGWTGALITAIPTAVFVIVNVTAGLRLGIVAAVGAAVLLTGYRLVAQAADPAGAVRAGRACWSRRSSRHAPAQARGYFLLGIWTSFLYAVPVRRVRAGAPPAGRA